MPTLSWLTREKDVKRADAVDYRLLERDDGLSIGPAETGNMLIQGDNLEALKSLLPFYRGQVKCILIDPPYNTRSAFDHYDDNLEHSQWLAMIWPRMLLLRELLAEDGSIWVTIDDHEGHYLKVVMDEVFGRRNFVANVVWQKRFSPNSTAQFLSDSHDHVLVFRKGNWQRNLLDRTEKSDSTYKNLDNDPRGLWTSSDLSARNFYSLGSYPVTTPSGRVIEGPPPGRYWTISKEKFAEFEREKRIWWGAKGDNQPRFKRFLSDVRAGVVPQTIWQHDEVGHTQEAKKEVLAFNATDVFATPKPERLVERILRISTKPGDLVLDSFLGSGTTAAVAHKMGRRWIGVENGDHAITHCAPRLKKVIEGEQGGISKSVGWKGGGGFSFYRLGEAVFDADGAINPGISFAPLAAHIWFSETHSPFARQANGPFLGSHDGRGIALLYNGILGDKRVSGGNVLTRKTLGMIREAAGSFHGPITVYGEASRLSGETLQAERISFKQTPYDVRAR